MPKPRQLFALAIFAVQFALTFIAGNSGLVGEGTNREVSDKNRVIFTPPSTAFAIWGIIFTLVSITAVWQLVSKQGRRWSEDPKILAGWIIMNVCQAGWAFSFPYSQMRAGSVLIFLDWVGLLLATQGNMEIFFSIWPAAGPAEASVQKALLSKSAEDDGTVRDDEEQGPKAAIKWWIFAQLGIGLQLGWLTAATGVQWTIAAARESNSISTQVAGVVIAGALISTTAFWRSVLIPDVSVALGVVWALSWITQIDPQLPVRVGNNTVIAPREIADGVNTGATVLASAIGGIVLAALVARCIAISRASNRV